MRRTIIFLMLLLSIAHAQENLRAPVALLRSGGESGTAFLVGQQSGQLYLLTAAHVIEDATDIQLYFRGNYRVEARIVNSDAETDLAAIRCPIPSGMSIPDSYVPASDLPVFDQPVRMVGHPLGEMWDIVSGTVKDPIGLSGRFSITPTGIDRGCSGGPVLTASYELLGMLQQDGRQKAWCRSVQTLTTACRIWKVPDNLLTGIPEETPMPDPTEEAFAFQLQKANTAFQARAWQRAKTAYQQAYKLKPDPNIQKRVRTCEEEIEKDRQYMELYHKGLAATDLTTALSFYQQAQQIRNTSDIRRLILNTETALQEIEDEQPDDSKSGGTYTDPLIGTMVLVRGGEFRMGSNHQYKDEKPLHPVTVADFYIGETEVTQQQWRTVMGSDPPRLAFPGCDACPVEGVSWEDVQAFLGKLNKQTGLAYRLPTEAEWEYAAGGGSGQRSKWAGTDEEDRLGDYAWYDSNSEFKTHPVRKKEPNALGLYDMSGNVWEWCEDDWHSDYRKAPDDGRPWVKKPRGSNRVLRGGGWGGNSGFCRVASRFGYGPSGRDSGLGFRLARQF
ncbi:MAG: SUMF1/EgtB/PvdO family nonheme iron enzyme [Bacteroidota bacterium]